jgi:hypothetical protein
MTKREVKTPKKTGDAMEILDRMMGKDSWIRRLAEEPRINPVVAQLS